MTLTKMIQEAGYIDISTMARRCGYTPHLFHYYLSQGHIPRPTTRIGRRYYYSKGEAASIAAEHTVTLKGGAK